MKGLARCAGGGQCRGAGSQQELSWMARLPRVVIPGIPHHVTQRGNRRERTFFEEGDSDRFPRAFRPRFWGASLRPFRASSAVIQDGSPNQAGRQPL